MTPQSCVHPATTEASVLAKQPLANRRGAALLLAIFSLIVIAVLVAGAQFASTQEFRGGRNSLVEQRAFAVAEYGLNSEISNWDRSRNLPPSPGSNGMPVGGIDSSKVYVANGDTARVTITRLTPNTFWVTSEGMANLGVRSLESRRLTNAMVRIAYPSITPKGAITAAGDVTLTGSSFVDGDNSDPGGWSHCSQIPADSVPAIAVGLGATVTYKPQNIGSTPAVVYDAAAADSNTYIRFGSETWKTLTANADINLAQFASGGTINLGTGIAPVLTPDGFCADSALNWGEPTRPGVQECYKRYPIIYSPTSLHLNGKGRGQGILLVNGDLEINGTFDFYGIVIVRDDIKKGNGTATIQGAVFAANTVLNDPTVLSGNKTVLYSKCAVESALRGSAILVRAKERGWTQLY